MPQSPLGHVLVIDDDADTRSNLRDILELDDYQIDTAGSAAEALARPDWSRYTAVILDRKLPDGSAEELLPRLRQLAPRAAILIVTGYADLEGAIAALRQGAADYILKPINADALRASLARIAERRRTAEEIQRLNKDLQHRVTELETLLAVIPVGIAISQDQSCHLVRMNPAFGRLLHRLPDTKTSFAAPPQEWPLGPPYKVCRDNRELPLDELPLQHAARHGVEVQDVELDVVQPNGEVINLIGTAAPLRDEHGKPRGAVGAFLDITERKRLLERQLQTERLAAIGQMMTGLAHESGNALARSRACLEMLAWETQDQPEAQELIERIQKAQDHLQQLYEEVRGYAAPVKLDRETWNVAGIWRQAWQNLAMRRQGRQAVLHEETDGVDLACSVDSFRLDQVFRNILENALAACADPVHIIVHCADSELAGRPALLVAVRDNGPGLSGEQCQRIFEPFFTTKTKGTGLGMAIAERIVKAHGGRITAGNGAGRGAEIAITLPREPP